LKKFKNENVKNYQNYEFNEYREIKETLQYAVIKERKIMSTGKIKKNNYNNRINNNQNNFNLEGIKRENSRNNIYKNSNLESSTNKKSKSLSIFRPINNKLQAKQTYQNNINIIKDLNHNENYLKKNLNSSKYKNKNLDKIDLKDTSDKHEENKIQKGKFDKIVNDAIIENLNEKFNIKLNKDKNHNHINGNIEIIEHQDLKIARRYINNIDNGNYSKVAKNEDIELKINCKNDELYIANLFTTNPIKSIQENGNSSKAKNSIQRSRNSELISNNSSSNIPVNRIEINNKYKKNTFSGGEGKKAYINKNNSAIGGKENSNIDIASILNKKFIVIGGYPAVKEALIKRNCVELNDSERYFQT